MIRKYMLDTNTCIYTIKRRPLEVLDTFNKHAGQMCISTVTLAELYHGVERSQQVERNLRNVEDFISRLEVVDYSSQAASHYGEIYANLQKKGLAIEANDLHIAAHARSLGLILVTNDEDFNRVAGLRLENWLKAIT